jgi:integrase
VARKWGDFDFDGLTLLVQRSIVHGRIGDVKTEYSRDRVPLDPALVQALMQHKERSYSALERWLFANPVTGKPYHQEQLQKRHIGKAGVAAKISSDIGCARFGTATGLGWMMPGRLSRPKELMHHASIQTTMNIYGEAVPDAKRQAHRKVAVLVFKSSKTEEGDGREGADGRYWELMGVCVALGTRATH